MVKHYVLVDIEWVENSEGHRSPTQLAAMRVDACWNPVQTIFTLIRPLNSSFHKWNHVAFTGGNIKNFLSGKSAFHALEDLDNWLKPDEIICWWNGADEQTYAMLVKRVLKKPFKQKSVTISRYLRKFLKGGKSSDLNPYALAKQNNIDVPLPEHCAINDVNTMQLVLKGIGFPQDFLNHTPKKVHTEKVTGARSYNYYLDVATHLLHKAGSDCISGSALYQGFSSLEGCIKRKLKPCPLCMKEEFDQGRRNLYKDMISRTEYKYIYPRIVK